MTFLKNILRLGYSLMRASWIIGLVIGLLSTLINPIVGIIVFITITFRIFVVGLVITEVGKLFLENETEYDEIIKDLK